MKAYSENFYKVVQEVSEQTSKEIVPIVIDLIHPKTVIDVGCGVGTWLAAFMACGVDDVLGLDGIWVDTSSLQIPKERFQSVNLEKPIQLDQSFDLVLSLEVAEHLAPKHAAAFVESLTRLGPVVLFSAAIPFQGGMEHKNEQWQDYWAEHFRRNGYVPVDRIRNIIWRNDNVAYFYAQNMLLYVQESRHADYPNIQVAINRTNISMLSLVHPKAYLHAVHADIIPDPKSIPFKKLLSALPASGIRAIKKRIRGAAGKK